MYPFLRTKISKMYVEFHVLMSQVTLPIEIFLILLYIIFLDYQLKLFNGDFVDRGSFSVECIFTLLGFKLLYPNHFFMSRGRKLKSTFFYEFTSCNRMNDLVQYL